MYVGMQARIYVCAHMHICVSHADDRKQTILAFSDNTMLDRVRCSYGDDTVLYGVRLA